MGLSEPLTGAQSKGRYFASDHCLVCVDFDW